MRAYVYVLLFHLESILSLAYRCSTDDTTSVSLLPLALVLVLVLSRRCQIIKRLLELRVAMVTVFTFSSLSLSLAAYVIITRGSIIVRSEQS